VTAVISPPSSPELKPQTWQPQTWEWQGHQINYVEWGPAAAAQGTPLLLLHGFGASIGHWQKNIPVLAAAGYHVWAIDLLGFGASDKPALPYTMELWQTLVQDFWQAKIQQPMVVVGNSIGGLLTLMLLADQSDIPGSGMTGPNMILGGILLNPAGGLNHRPDELNPLLGRILGTFSQLASSAWLGPWLFNQVRQKSRIRNSLKQVYRNQAAVTDELVEMLHRPSCDPGAQKVFAAILSAPAGPRPTDLLPKIHVPLLILWGEDDPWTPIAAAADYRQAAQERSGETPNASITIIPIPRTGHCPHDERPELVNPCILAWLRQQAG
jgi:pimeloyl-ACP methyl ester carboxylesterase